MARQPRLCLPGFAHHVIQRGNNRQAIFKDKADFEFMLQLLLEYCRSFKVDVHAYVLMDNHFHLLLTPHSDNGLPQMMQAVGRRYVQYFNRRHGRTGTLWEGRYRSTVVQTERYLLACMVYIDLNPVRAGMVGQASDWLWSSYGSNAGMRQDRLLTPHALYWALGNTPFAREATYAGLVQAGLPPGQQTALTRTTLSGWAWGDDAFIASLQTHTDRRLAPGRPGRPSQSKSD